MAAIDVLQSAWETEIAKISDALIQADASYTLEVYIAAVQQQASLEAKDIASYSIGGRTFTYRDVLSGQQAIQQLKNQLHDQVYGRSNLVDFNTRDTISGES
jgi:hypothetical protein